MVGQEPRVKAFEVPWGILSEDADKHGWVGCGSFHLGFHSQQKDEYLLRPFCVSGARNVLSQSASSRDPQESSGPDFRAEIIEV